MKYILIYALMHLLIISYSQINIIEIRYPSTLNDSNGLIDISVFPESLDYHYFWNTGDTTEDIHNLKSGYYSVTITGGSLCWAEAHFVFTSCDDTLIVDPLIVDHQMIWNSENNTGNVYVFVEGGANERFYRWSDGEGIISYDIDLLNKPQGIYYLSVFDGCTQINDTITLGSPPILPLKSGDKKIKTNESNEVTFDISTDLDEYFRAYPNPFYDEFIIDIFTKRRGVFEIALFDILGKELFNAARYSQNENWSEKIALKEIYASGVYYLQIKHEGTRIFLSTLIKLN